jgi:hypothetical protein
MRSHLRIVRFVHYILKTFVNLCVCLLFHLYHSEVLVRTNEEERKKYFVSLIQGLTNFGHELMKTPGPTFLGVTVQKNDDKINDVDNDQQQQEQQQQDEHQSQPILSYVDIALIPFACRFDSLEQYHGSEYRIPNDTVALQAYHQWYDYVMTLPAVVGTLPDKTQFLHHIRKFVEHRANTGSQLAQIVATATTTTTTAETCNKKQKRESTANNNSQ